MPATPKALRTRNMTTAKRSLTLIRDAAQRHAEQLESGAVPEDGFAVYVLKYETALAALRTLDALGEAAPPHDPVEVERDHLDLLIHLLRQSDMAGVIVQAEDGSPISKLLSAIEDKPGEA